jgi:hypothetical protein
MPQNNFLFLFSFCSFPTGNNKSLALAGYRLKIWFKCQMHFVADNNYQNGFKITEL